MPRATDFLSAAMLTAGVAAGTAILIVLLKPWLQRYALARPNARSSHTIPTPQGGGVAVVIAVAAVIVLFALSGAPAFREPWVVSVLVALGALAVAGAIDDIKPLPVLPRFVLQVAVAALLVMTLPGEARVLPVIPVVIERGLLVVALVWFINLTNFMDGIDGMTVAEMVPICVALAILGLSGMVPAMGRALPVVLALTGALIGFAPFNRHVARLFLGDVGSLPIGALVGWLLIVLAASGQLYAAIILPLYYVADATITLLRRWRNGEKLSQAHRSHFYQHAVQRGFSVPEVTTRVLALNAALGVLAITTIVTRVPLVAHLSLALAVAATLVTLRQFEQGRIKQGRGA